MLLLFFFCVSFYIRSTDLTPDALEALKKQLYTWKDHYGANNGVNFEEAVNYLGSLHESHLKVNVIRIILYLT